MHVNPPVFVSVCVVPRFEYKHTYKHTHVHTNMHTQTEMHTHRHAHKHTHAHNHTIMPVMKCSHCVEEVCDA